MSKILLIPSYVIHLKHFIEYECSIDFDKCITINSDIDEKTVIEQVKQYNEAYFVDFDDKYRKILPYIPFKTKCFSIFTNEVAEFTNPGVLSIYNSIIEFLDRMIYKKIFTISYDLCSVLKNSKYNVEQMQFKLDLDVSKKKNKRNIIGIISNDFNPNHNFYNILTALTMVNSIDKIKLISHMPATIEFIERFNLPVEFCDDIDDVICDSTLNIYSNFTANNYSLFKKSLDLKIPCMVGNIDSNVRKAYSKDLIMESDDNVCELTEKIKKYIN